MGKQVFISYRSTDRDKVARLAADIEKLDYTVWFDRKLTGGQEWWNQILQQMRESDFIVVALSPNVVNSEACRNERIYARMLGKAILPVSIAEGVSMSLFEPELAKIQSINYINPNAESAFALAKAIHTLPPSSALPNPLPQEPPVPGSYLNDLVAKVNQPEMNYQEQNYVLGEIKRTMNDSDNTGDVVTLLERFSERPDVSQSLAREAGDLLRQLRGNAPAPAPIKQYVSSPSAPSPSYNFTSNAQPLMRDYMSLGRDMINPQGMGEGLHTALYYGLMVFCFLFPLFGWIGAGILYFADNPSMKRKSQARNIAIAGVAGIAAGVVFYLCTYMVALSGSRY
jgi:hypothetical protein